MSSVHPNIPYTDSSSSQSSVTIIQLVNSKQSTRPFLQNLWKPHIDVPDFSELIRSNPFRKPLVKLNSDTTLNHPTPKFFSSNTPKDTLEEAQQTKTLNRRSNSVGFFSDFPNVEHKSKFSVQK